MSNVAVLPTFLMLTPAIADELEELCDMDTEELSKFVSLLVVGYSLNPNEAHLAMARNHMDDHLAS